MVDASISPTGEMVIAAEGLVNVCQTMLGLTLEPAPRWTPFDSKGLAYGGSIHLIHEEGCWEVGLFGDEKTCSNMTMAMLAMDEGEQPAGDEIVDALGELVNIVVGMLKRKIGGGEHGETQIGVPLFLLGEDCQKHAPRKIPMHTLCLSSPDFEGQLIFVWSERTRQALLAEIAAWLGAIGPSDKKGLARVRALFDELLESIDSDADESCWTAIEESLALLAALINEDKDDSDKILEVVSDTVEHLRPALEVGAFSVTVPSPAQAIEAIRKGAPVERDEDSIAMLHDFLEESEEGLDRADEMLMRVEGGSGTDEEVHGLFRVFHTIKGVSGFLDLEDITGLGHATEHLLSEVREGKIQLAGVALEMVFESTGLMRSLLGDVSQAVESGAAFARNPAVTELISRLDAGAKGQAPVPASKPRQAPAPQAASSKRDRQRATLRVDLDLIQRLDASLGRLGEVSPQIGTHLEGVAPDLKVRLEGCFTELGELLTLMQMTSLDSLFQKMARMVRDLSKKTEKLAQLVTEGADTKVERNIAEKVGEPLVHMIRNAVDHGLEDEAGRREADKPLLGTVTLKAERRESCVVIVISDDGKGLDRSAILKKAESKGLVEDGSNLTDKEVFQLIFAPGFSTAAAVTAISGRGVGMDVVKRNIEALGGRIEVTSTFGHGTKFELVLPSAAVRTSETPAPAAAA